MKKQTFRTIWNYAFRPAQEERGKKQPLVRAYSARASVTPELRRRIECCARAEMMPQDRLAFCKDIINNPSAMALLADEIKSKRASVADGVKPESERKG